MRNFTAIIPSYMSGTLTNITCCSMIKNKPEDVFLNIIIVENSEIDSYKDHILKLNVFENSKKFSRIDRYILKSNS